MTPREICEAYVASGYRFIPLTAKKPIHDGYLERTYSLDDLNGHNTGLMLTGTLTDIDLDWPETAWFDGAIPTCDALFGRDRLTHALFDSDVDAFDFKLPDNIRGAPKLEGEHAHTILQIRRGPGRHVMMPPSTHPSGEELRWYNRKDQTSNLPNKVDPDELMRGCGLMAACAFFVRFYPCEGTRDDCCTAIAGTLVRAGFDAGLVDDVVWAIAMRNDDKDPARRRKGTLAAKRLDAGKRVRGLPFLAKCLGLPIEWLNEVGIWVGARSRHEGKPRVHVSNDIEAMSSAAWHALEAYTHNGEPGVYTYGTALARLNDARIEVLDKTTLKYELVRCASWGVIKEDKWLVAKPPMDVVFDVLAARTGDRATPELNALTTVPVFTPNGSLITAPGYDYETGTFYDPSCEVEVPVQPTREDVDAARDLLLSVIADFPFEHQSDLAHCFGLYFEHVCRNMWIGSSPMYLVNKPSPGTGASLAVSCLLYVPLGFWPPEKSPPTNETEMEKVLTTFLMEGSPVVYLDNCDWLFSSTLAMALTAQTYKSRILGSSTSIEVPVRCSWIATGNNPEMSSELYRRMIDVRMDAGVEHPEDRPPETFAIPNLRQYVVAERDRVGGVDDCEGMGSGWHARRIEVESLV